VTAWTDSIDAQITALDAQVTAETAKRAALVVQQGFAVGQALDQLTDAIEALDAILAARAEWRAVLEDARSLGYLPDPRSKFYNEDLGGFLQ
jgi:hypothetical protein